MKDIVHHVCCRQLKQCCRDNIPLTVIAWYHLRRILQIRQNCHLLHNKLLILLPKLDFFIFLQKRIWSINVRSRLFLKKFLSSLPSLGKYWGAAHIRWFRTLIYKKVIYTVRCNLLNLKKQLKEGVNFDWLIVRKWSIYCEVGKIFVEKWVTYYTVRDNFVVCLAKLYS